MLTEEFDSIEKAIQSLENDGYCLVSPDYGFTGFYFVHSKTPKLFSVITVNIRFDDAIESLKKHNSKLKETEKNFLFNENRITYKIIHDLSFDEDL